MKTLHFVTGGFSGATQVAIDLCLHSSEKNKALLVLRRKKNTTAEKIKKLSDAGVNILVVPGWSHLATIIALRKICKNFQPDILFAHGFSEHLWGRYAGLLAGVPNLVHVEHNMHERYSKWRLIQAKWLSHRTACIVACSEGVREHLVHLGFEPEKIKTIKNGIDTERFSAFGPRSLVDRNPTIVMVSRFAKQKDQKTLIEAIWILKKRHIDVSLNLIGSGKKTHQRKLKSLVDKLELSKCIQFSGSTPNIAKKLHDTAIFILSTHYEGLPLALLEAMCSGCLVIGSDVPGVREAIKHGEDGYLVPPMNPTALADQIEVVIKNISEQQNLADTAKMKVLNQYNKKRMVDDYENIYISLI